LLPLAPAQRRRPSCVCVCAAATQAREHLLGWPHAHTQPRTCALPRRLSAMTIACLLSSATALMSAFHTTYLMKGVDSSASVRRCCTSNSVTWRSGVCVHVRMCVWVCVCVCGGGVVGVGAHVVVAHA
jgi:hypothetical protein